MKNVLVFGGTGFIGSSLCNRLLKKGYSVQAFDNNERGHKGTSLYTDIEIISGDVCNYDDVRKAIMHRDIVINLAYINGTQNFYTRAGRILEIAAFGQLNIGKAINELGVETFIYASSSEAYQNPNEFPTTEAEVLKVPDPTNPRFSYGGGKIFGELCTMHHVFNTNRKVIFRPHNVYGPNMGFDHVIPALFQKIADSECANDDSFLVQGAPTDSRSFIYIDDCCSAIQALMESPHADGIYNIGSGKETSIGELVTRILDITGSSTNPLFEEPRTKGSVLRRVPDVSRLLSLGWAPQTILDDGLRQCWAEIKGNSDV